MTARLMIPTRAALLAISLAGLVACSGPEKADEAAKPVALVTTAVLQRARLDETLTAFGAVEVAPSGERSLTAATEATCPSAIGATARKTAAVERSCSPRATANSQPIAGLMPW